MTDFDDYSLFTTAGEGKILQAGEVERIRARSWSLSEMHPSLAQILGREHNGFGD